MPDCRSRRRTFGDDFEEQSIAWGRELSTKGFGFDPELIWVSVFEGDEELGLGPDAEAIEIWRAIGVPEEADLGVAALEELLLTTAGMEALQAVLQG